MRFLCLHGIGTSSQLFKMQTTALRYELGDEHTYEFVQGSLPWSTAPEISSISNPGDQHYAYSDPDSPHSYISALDQLSAYVENEGPFDGVLAFSQGAGLAIQYMAQRKVDSPLGRPPFKCAILFAPTAAGDVFEWRKTGEGRLLKQLPNRLAIDTPTALIWGTNDPWRDMFERDCNIWNENLLWRYTHDGGHEVPGPNVKGSMSGTIKLMRRAITLGSLFK